MSYFESTGDYNKMAAMPAKFNSNQQIFQVVYSVESDDKIGYVCLHPEHRWQHQNGSYMPTKFYSNQLFFQVVDSIESDDVKIGYVCLH